MAKKEELSSNMEDYLEAILILSENSEAVRSREIMEFLGVTGPSVTEAFQQLAEKKLINYTPYAPITLTEKGADIAGDVYYRHKTLRTFFTDILLVEEKMADECACKMEHVVSKGIVNRMVAYTDYYNTMQDKENCPNTFADFLEQE